ncbi:hypothetical protein CPB84DRAFT_1850693 [Gymnopilus junonius]|uniref:Uncharacterized protein n=1 Tax=Gymnopilus junonius TaxID=109634 RepID=A0A9P5NFB3_GYMJU|nr:hypothetical protein CPB84DRAFT_1850693 [Gymnopilus junonius]
MARAKDVFITGPRPSTPESTTTPPNPPPPSHHAAPARGMGGGQAIEDAYILGRFLSHLRTTRENIQQALIAYQTICRQAAVENSHINGLMYEFKHPDYPVSPDAEPEDMKKLSNAIVESFRWLADGTCNDDLQQAIEILENGGLESV